MKQINSLTSVPEDLDILTGIDLIGNIKRLFKNPTQMPGCLFLLCIRGHCSITIHLSKYELKKNSIAVIFPHQFVQVTDESKDCRFVFVGFSKKLIQSPPLFSRMIEYTPSIFEEPVIELKSDIAEVFYEYFKVLVKALRLPNSFITDEQAHLICSQLVLGLGNIYKQGESNERPRYNRNQEIVKELIRIVVQNYKSERNISFYAEKMHLSPQHLSTTIKKTTGKTLTDIISTFVIRDAQAKLRSTELTIQEIAYSLNFPDISFFGKYFKRYTGMSPKQYRNMEE